MTAQKSVTSDEIDAWLSGISQESAETIVTSDGAGWSFNCDGTAHYLQCNDVTKREPNGRYKRVYKGKITGGHVTYKGITSTVPCPNQYERWAKIRHVTCKIPRGSGKDEGLAGDSKGLVEHLGLPNAEWADAKTAYIQ